MADPITTNAPDDDLLTAFLDGELGADDRRAMEARLASDPSLRARFDALAGSARPFAQAFAMVLEAAPAERLQATLTEIAPHAGPVAPRRVWMSAAAVLLFAVGIAVGVGTGNGPPPFAFRENAPALVLADRSADTPASKVTAAPPAARVRVIPFGPGGPADVLVPTTPLPPPASLALVPAKPTESLARQAEPQQLATAPVTAVPKAVGEVQPQTFASGSAAPVSVPTVPSASPSGGAPGLAAASPPPSVPAATANAAASGLAAVAPAAPAVDALGTLQPPPSWRQVVVEYLVLTTAETLALVPENPRLPDAVAAYAAKLQLDMSAEKLALPMAALKDVRLFDYRGRPVVEAAYLSDDAIAVAFCIILNGQTDVPMGFEQREGQNVVFWTKGGHGYMVAGKASRERLEAIALDFAARFS